MKYIIRATKYFFYFCILLVLILSVLVAVGMVEANINSMFRNGYESLWQILIMMVLFGATYPLFGFTKRETIVPGAYSEIRQGVIDYMESKGYVLTREEGESMAFRSKSMMKRIFRMFEDTIILSRSFSGFTMEGLRKDVDRLRYGMEYKFRHPEE